MSKAKKSKVEAAAEYLDDHVVEPIADSKAAKKMEQYADSAKDSMMEIGDNVESMMESFKNHQEVEKLQSDIKKGLNKLGKSSKKVAEDVKDLMD